MCCNAINNGYIRFIQRFHIELHVSTLVSLKGGEKNDKTVFIIPIKCANTPTESQRFHNSNLPSNRNEHFPRIFQLKQNYLVEIAQINYKSKNSHQPKIGLNLPNCAIHFCGARPPNWCFLLISRDKQTPLQLNCALYQSKKPQHSTVQAILNGMKDSQAKCCDTISIWNTHLVAYLTK